MQGPTAGALPLPYMRNVQVVQTLSAGVDSILPHLGQLPPGVRLCNARGVHEASTAELALTLILSSLRGIPASSAARTTRSGTPASTRRSPTAGY